MGGVDASARGLRSEPWLHSRCARARARWASNGRYHSTAGMSAMAGLAASIASCEWPPPVITASCEAPPIARSAASWSRAAVCRRSASAASSSVAAEARAALPSRGALGELDGATCPEPVTYYRDVSFWVTDPDCFSEATLHDVVKDTAGYSVDATCSTFEEYVHEDGRVSRTIRVAYSSRMLAYSKQRANASQFALRDAFEAGRVPGSELR